jgi:UDP-glucose 4-epimerase
MVVPRFVHAAIRNEPIQVHGDGMQSRCFGHVHDIVEGLTKLLDSPECFGQVINIGNSEETSIKGLADRAIALTGKQELRYSSFHTKKLTAMDSKTCAGRVPSLDKAKRLIGYQPTRSLDDIINDVANEYRNEVAAAA